MNAPVGTAAERLVLVALADACRRGGRQSWPSHKRLEHVTLLTRKAVRAALKGLVARGLIRDTGARKGDTGRVVVYELNRVAADPVTPQPNGGESDPIVGHSNEVGSAPIQPQVMGSFGIGNGVAADPIEWGQKRPPESGNRSLTRKNQEKQRAVRVLPEGVDRQLWNAWLDMHAPTSRKGIALDAKIDLLLELRAKGHDPNAVLRQSLANGWKSLAPLRTDTAATPAAGIKCGKCGVWAKTWTDGLCDPCWQERMGFGEPRRANLAAGG